MYKQYIEKIVTPHEPPSLSITSLLHIFTPNKNILVYSETFSRPFRDNVIRISFASRSHLVCISFASWTIP